MIDQNILTLIFLALTAITVTILWRARLLTLPSTKDGAGIAVMSPLIGFLLFLSIAAYVPQWMERLLRYFDMHGMSSFSAPELAGWSQLAAIVVSAIVLVGFTFIHSQEMQSRIWALKSGAKTACASVLKGVLYCLLTYPIVMALVQAIHLTLSSLGYEVSAEQVAITYVKSLQSYPILFWSVVASVVTLVPLVEELLFRGLLQNFFQGVFGAKAAIVLASILFAIFHYASIQSDANVELMTGLFFYSLFMGIFYVRTRSLWVSIGMHAAFNALSICMVLYVV